MCERFESITKSYTHDRPDLRRSPHEYRYTCMQLPIWIHRSYQSQFDLLGAMASELCQAFVECGYEAKLIDIAHDPSPTSGAFLFFNTPQSLDQLPRALFDPQSDLVGIQLHVDHPFALPDTILDEWTDRNKLDRYRLMLPCLDDAHLLRARFPSMVHSWMPHGIPRSSLCATDTLTSEAFAEREFDVVMTGSIQEQDQINAQIAKLDANLRAMLSDVVHLMIREPHLGYVGAMDLAMGSRGVITGKWETQRYLWGLTIAMVNRHRRIETVKAMQGLKVGVFGSLAWKEHCTGTIQYAGEVKYESCSSAFARGRIALAWGPTQFVHSYSERIMQAMAGGACCVVDDRILVRRDFARTPDPDDPQQTGESAVLFDWRNVANARNAVDSLLGDPDRMVAIGRRGRGLVEARCLWEHRVEQILHQITEMTGSSMDERVAASSLKRTAKN
jgi:Glycosyl transferases group 1